MTFAIEKKAVLPKEIDTTLDDLGNYDVPSYILREISFYVKASASNFKMWYILVIVTIVGSAVGGLCAVAPSPDNGWKILLGVPSLLATVAASLNSAMSYRSECLRQSATVEALRRETMKFQNKFQPYNGMPKEALATYANISFAILDKELSTWVDSHQGNQGSGNASSKPTISLPTINSAPPGTPN